MMKEFVFKDFPLNVKVGKNKMERINGQSIYNGRINRYQRAKMIGEMKEWIGMLMNTGENRKQLSAINDYPVRIDLTVNCPINMNAWIFSNAVWRETKQAPNWDLSNLCWIWMKVFEDVLQDKRVIPNDNVNYIQAQSVSLINTTFAKRSLVFTVTKI